MPQAPAASLTVAPSAEGWSRRRAIVGLAALSTGCASGLVHTGADAGWVVIGIGAPPGFYFSSYHFQFRRQGSTATTDGTSRMIYRWSDGLFGDRPDYKTEREAGIVTSASLAPGHYEVFGFELHVNLGMMSQSFRSARPFRIPFEIRSGEISYIGNYLALPRYAGRHLGMPVRQGAYFSIESRAAADTAMLIRKSLPGKSPKVNDQTPDAATLGVPFLITPAQRQAIMAVEPQWD